MANLTIRNFDDGLKSLLRQQAARHGCSMEQEVRNILSQAIHPTVTGSDFAKRINERFARLKVNDLPIPTRRVARLPSLSKG